MKAKCGCGIRNRVEDNHAYSEGRLCEAWSPEEYEEKSLEELFQMLPQDVIINHIAPYIYLTKPENLLLDIRTITSDQQIIEEYYFTMLNEHILMSDLIKYYRETYGFTKIWNISKLLFRLCGDNIDTKQRLLLAKMTPNDRVLFINDYIIMDDE